MTDSDDSRGAARTFAHEFDRHQGHPTRPPANEQLPVSPLGRELSADRLADPASSADGLGAWLGESFLVGSLYVLACLAGGLGVVGGLLHLAAAAERGVRPADALAVAAWLVGGLAVAGAMLAIGSVMNSQAVQRRRLRDLSGELSQLAERIERIGNLMPDPAAPGELARRLDALAEAVAEVAHNSLLDESARADKRRLLAQRARDQALDQVRREMTEGRWDHAAGAVERFRVNFPAEADQAVRLADELGRRRNQAEADDVAEARRRCEELMSVSAWDRARAAAEELLSRHPDSTAARSLLSRVELEQRKATDELRRMLYARIQRHTSRRQWREALEAAQQLVGQYPDSIEAEAVKAQLDTLASNAEIQHRQQLEESIKDLVKRQRYREAVELAEQVIADYPSSPQAAALRDQLPRLRERSDEADREARKRRVQWS